MVIAFSARAITGESAPLFTIAYTLRQYERRERNKEVLTIKGVGVVLPIRCSSIKAHEKSWIAEFRVVGFANYFFEKKEHSFIYLFIISNIFIGESYRSIYRYVYIGWLVHIDLKVKIWN